MAERFMITADMIKFDETETVTGVDGKSIEVKSAIPYEEKEQMAKEYVAYTTVLDEENYVVYESYQTELIELLLTCKYYTNIDTEEMQDEHSWKILYDYLAANKMLEELRRIVQNDFYRVLGIGSYISDSLKKTFEAKHSLSVRLLKTFGSILTEEDMAETLAKSEEVNSVMLDLIGAYKEKSANKTMRTGNGTVVNFSKKKK